MHTDATQSDKWFRIVKGEVNAGIRLVCFPHAGGSASFFHHWGRLFPARVEVLAVRYPGREDRILDPVPDTIEDLADRLALACSVLDGTPLAFFGHSMGAAVAHEVAQRVESLLPGRLACLFVSGCAGPGRGKSRRDLSALSDSHLVENVRMLGGTSPAVLDNSELRQLFLPIFRADFRLVARHSISSSGIVQAPIIAYYGDQDEDLDEESVSAWSTVTKSTFAIRRFRGGHFYLTDHTAGLVADMCDHLVHR